GVPNGEVAQGPRDGLPVAVFGASRLDVRERRVGKVVDVRGVPLGTVKVGGGHAGAPWVAAGREPLGGGAAGSGGGAASSAAVCSAVGIVVGGGKSWTLTRPL